VALLVAPAVVQFSYGVDANLAVRIPVAVAAVLIIVVAVYVSKRRGVAMDGDEGDEGDEGGEGGDASPRSESGSTVVA
jgi:K(+)-stimulated pyrophosphate-energized sodium pump